jgi:predicted pyridoxine 5'-phosphate oxidase superfamily flavin-nucleotide-binding protein
MRTNVVIASSLSIAEHYFISRINVVNHRPFIAVAPFAIIGRSTHDRIADMPRSFAEIAFTPSVQALQRKYGSRAQYARSEARAGESALAAREREFLEQADSFYLASVGENGWPYVQHRGGPRGFVRVRSPSQIAFADFRGNLQYISAGNVSRDDRVSLIVVDYAHRRRLKLLGHLQFVDVADADAGLVASVALPGYRATVERIAIVDVVAFDWNCPQHIAERFTRDDVDAITRPLEARIAALEAESRRSNVRAPER